MPIQYASWYSFLAGQPKVLLKPSVKLLDTGIVAFCFDTLCQLAYMIYITNANARINILSITAGCREYRLFGAHSNSSESVTTLPRPPSRLGGVEFGQLIVRKIV